MHCCFAYTRQRLTDMLEFLTAMTGLFEEVIGMPAGAWKSLVKLGGKGVTMPGNVRKKAAGYCQQGRPLWQLLESDDLALLQTISHEGG